MTDLAKIKKHVQLFDRMGKAVGLDLEEEATSGHLQFEEIAEAVMRCSRCSAPQACQGWLDQNEARGQLEETAGSALKVDRTPKYCRNADLFSYLHQAR
ncbi:hypothetical protein KMP13_13780 [Epibacterium ulvae]|uniref:DUF6455 family protein n=1 Tax=Epibacterium ulvae TaxID=1156985 RepID=UPI001BFCA740|nr:DUF6455 family protein [Epibacterium ulvae]MBT8154933.1 hypothetical protein [Epibacterium ulvae]